MLIWEQVIACKLGARSYYSKVENAEFVKLFPVTVAMDASSDGEEEVENSDQMTETVMNGSMKETLSLTVDAKTETAVF